MDWLLLYEVIYTLIVILVCLRIIYNINSTTKTLAYLLLVIFVPFAGILFYFLFGTNHRSRKMYSKKLIQNDEMAERLRQHLIHYSKQTFQENNAAVHSHKELAKMLLKETMSPLTGNNAVKLLINGEEKFPEVLRAMEAATHHIHIEYYIYEDDEIGRAIENVLVRKVKEGVTVRFIYDYFGSHSIRRKFVRRMRANHIQIFPFLRVYFPVFANRINYRNHRKIIVIDGHTAFVGGINVSDRYINDSRYPKRGYWRDTHLRIDGPGVQYLQYLFLCDWNFCADQKLTPDEGFFPRGKPVAGNKVVQIAAGGPDSKTPTILFSLLQVINLATEEILITTPYFIPGESLLDGLAMAALSGITVKLLVPDKSDSLFVNSAARSYYRDLLNAGVEIYQYDKGFVHAKTIVADGKIAVVGTANMDFRSFDLNFEVNAIVYNPETADALNRVFYEDLKAAKKIDVVLWNNRAWYKQLLERVARLVSPLL